MGYPQGGAGRARGPIGQGERLQRLVGERGKDDDGMAITKGQAAELGSIPITCAHVTAAPTAAQHNALVDDVRALAAVLNRMGAKFTGI